MLKISLQVSSSCSLLWKIYDRLRNKITQSASSEYRGHNLTHETGSHMMKIKH